MKFVGIDVTLFYSSFFIYNEYTVTVTPSAELIIINNSNN